MKKKTKNKKETKIQELERRIKWLEDTHFNPIINIPSYPPIIFPQTTTDPNLHYHNGQPCRNNPCVWF